MSDTRNIPLRDLVYSIPEAMEAAGLSRETIEGMIESGQLDTVKIGKREYISKMSVDNLIDAALHGGRTAAAPEALATVSPETTDPAEAERLLAAMCAAAPATD